MPSTFKWKEKYIKGGFSIFDTGMENTLRALRRKYSVDVHEFLRELAEANESKNVTSAQRAIVEAMQMATSIPTLIDKLLADNGIRATPEEIDLLFFNVTQMEQRVVELQEEYQRVSAFRERVNKVSAKTGVNLAGVSRVHQVAKGRLGAPVVPAGSLGERARKAAPGAYGAVSGIGQGILSATLGPFAGMARLAYGAGSGMYKYFREKKIERSKWDIAEALSTGKERTSVGLRGMYDYLSGTRPGLSEVIREQYKAGPRAEGRERMAGPSFTTGQRFAPAASLFAFFNKDAYVAKWTRDVTDSLHKLIGKKQMPGGGGGFGMFPAGGLASFAKIALPIIAGVAGLAMAAWDAFKAPKVAKERGWFGKPGEPISLSQKVFAGIGGALGGTGPGIGERGAKASDVSKNAMWNFVKVGLLSPSLAPAGGLLGSLGGRRIALGTQALWKGISSPSAMVGAALGFLVGGPMGALAGAAMGTGVGIAKWQESRAKSIIPESRVPLSAMPSMAGVGSFGQADVVRNAEKLNKSIDDLAISIKSSNQVSLPSADRWHANDVFSIRDPLLEAMNGGNLELED